MEIVKKLNVPAAFLYEKIIDSVLFDIRKETGESITKNQLKNFEYIKTYSANSSAKIKIEEHIENQSYHFRTSTTRNDYLVQYDIEAIDDKTCKLIYTEKMKSFGFLQQLNDAVVGTLLGYLKKRQFKKMLEMIEESY